MKQDDVVWRGRGEGGGGAQNPDIEDDVISVWTFTDRETSPIFLCAENVYQISESL